MLRETKNTSCYQLSKVYCQDDLGMMIVMLVQNIEMINVPCL